MCEQLEYPEAHLEVGSNPLLVVSPVQRVKDEIYVQLNSCSFSRPDQTI